MNSMENVAKNWLFEVLLLGNLLLVRSTACLSSLTAKKELTYPRYTTDVIQSFRAEIWTEVQLQCRPAVQYS